MKRPVATGGSAAGPHAGPPARTCSVTAQPFLAPGTGSGPPYVSYDGPSMTPVRTSVLSGQDQQAEVNEPCSSHIKVCLRY